MSSPSSSANPLNFEIEFGLGKGRLGPAPPGRGWLKASLPCLPPRKLGRGWAGWGRGWWLRLAEGSW